MEFLQNAEMKKKSPAKNTAGPSNTNHITILLRFHARSLANQKYMCKFSYCRNDFNHENRDLNMGKPSYAANASGLLGIKLKGTIAK